MYKEEDQKKKGKQKVELWIDHLGDYEKDNRDSETLKWMLVTRVMIFGGGNDD